MASEGRAAIEAAIPHRPPFLFVDRILARDARSIVTEWDVRADLDCFRGHYPGDPILPGVLVCEFAFQSAAILLSGAGSPSPEGAVPVVTRIEDARFKRPVRPGDVLRAELAVEESLANARWLSAKLSAGGSQVARLRFAVALAVPARGGAEGA